MKISMIKQAGGALLPQSEIEQNKMTRFKNDGCYEIEIKQTRNPVFLSKAMVFFTFCFEYWCNDIEGYEYLDEPAQFDSFRKNLTVLAGYKVVTWKIGGGFRVEAESLAFANMDEERFSSCYHALIQAALSNIFHGSDKEIYDKLHSFF